jgi:hypothetical protein
MKHLFSALCVATSVTLLASCASGPKLGGSYRVTAYKPHNPNNVRVKVSTSTQNVYVMEGDRCLMAVQGNVGTASNPTPSGRFTINNKIKEKRRVSGRGINAINC